MPNDHDLNAKEKPSPVTALVKNSGTAPRVVVDVSGHSHTIAPGASKPMAISHVEHERIGTNAKRGDTLTSEITDAKLDDNLKQEAKNFQASERRTSGVVKNNTELQDDSDREAAVRAAESAALEGTDTHTDGDKPSRGRRRAQPRKR
jgi:hypothetical protein